MELRIGQGFDAHAFAWERPLILGGVEVRDHGGLAGHSDADVLAHAITDALLGAAGLGDLGTHYSARDVPEGASSLDILTSTASLLAGAGFEVVNVDATVVIEGVRIAPHREAMIANLARSLRVDPGRVSVKATTTDGLGFAGRGEGAAALAVAMLAQTEGA